MILNIMEQYILILVILQYILFIFNTEYISKKIKECESMEDYHYYKIIQIVPPIITFLLLFSITYFNDIKACGVVVFMFILIMFFKVFDQ